MAEIWIKYGDNGAQLAQELLATAGVAEQLQPHMTVGIKPNLVLAKPSASGATTDPAVVEGVIRFLQAHGVSKITIMESSWVGDSTRRAFKACGYTDLAARYNVELLDLKDDATVTRQAGGLELQVCRAPLSVDLLINVPVLKAHCQTRLTCALKNLKGCIPDREKRRYHTLGLHEPIAALSRALPQHLVVVDGIIGDLTFEEGGTPVNMGRVLVGRDPVAMDAYCAELLGYSPEDIRYIGLAQSLGVGSTDSQITELNQGRQTSFQAEPLSGRFRRHIAEDQACSSCLGSLVHALQRLDEAGIRPPRTLAIGQGWQGRSGSQLGIGSCTAKLDQHVPGCPPTAAAIAQYIKEHRS